MSGIPTVYHGIPKDDDDTRAVQVALEAIIAILNSNRPGLMKRVVSSIVTTVCCNQDDPTRAFNEIGSIVAHSIAMHLEQPAGSA